MNDIGDPRTATKKEHNMEERDYLFVGGEHDGEWISTDGRPVWSLVGKDLNVIVYEGMRVAGNSKTHVVYAIKGTTSDLLIDMLINHYQPFDHKNGVEGNERYFRRPKRL